MSVEYSIVNNIGYGVKVSDSPEYSKIGRALTNKIQYEANVDEKPIRKF